MAVFPSFIFDTSKGETPQSIAQKRALAAQIMGGFGNRPARNVGEGVGNAFASLGQGITANVMNRRATAGEEAGQAAAGDLRQQLISTITGQGSFPPAPPAAAEGSASMPQTAEASAIRDGLVQRGLPSHVADAFVLNMQDESGLNPGINERNPIVPGSRGGFGLYQLTGPRRRAYEAFAAQRGTDPANVDAQLDFLVSELQGPEARAAQSILSAPDTGTAAQAIVNDFLRPAPEHRRRRTSRYAAYQGTPSEGGAVDALGVLGSAQPVPVAENEADIVAQEQAMATQDPVAFAQQQAMPQQPMQVAQAGGFPEMAGNNPSQRPPVDIGMLMQVMANPFMDEGTKTFAQAQLQQYMQGQDPMRQLDMDYKRAQIGKLQREATGPSELGLNPQYGVDANGNPVLIQIGKDGKAVQTALPEGVTLSKEPIKMDAGTHFVLLDPITRQPVGQIPKENREAARETAIGKIEGETLGEAQVNLGGTLQKADQSISLIDQMLEHPGFEAATGLSSIIDPRNYIAGTDATDFNVMRKQLEGKAFLEAFESLKGGGQITEVEGKKATEAIARLSTTQSEQAYREALMDLRGILELGKLRSMQRAGQGGEAASPTQSRRLRFNPQTGELE